MQMPDLFFFEFFCVIYMTYISHISHTVPHPCLNQFKVSPQTVCDRKRNRNSQARANFSSAQAKLLRFLCAFFLELTFCILGSLNTLPSGYYNFRNINSSLNISSMGIMFAISFSLIYVN